MRSIVHHAEQIVHHAEQIVHHAEQIIHHAIEVQKEKATKFIVEVENVM